MRRSLIVILGITALLISGCFSSTSSNVESVTNGNSSSQVSAPSARIQAQLDASGATPVDYNGRAPDNSEKVIIQASNFKFTPNRLTLSQGDEITVRLVSSVGFHDFHIDELNIASDRVNTGQATEFVISAERPGTYEFYSAVANDRNLGMHGSLIIE